MARNTTRRRSSRRTPRLDFAAIEITGALLTPDIVARIASFDAADQTEEAYGVPPGLKIRDEIARYFRIAEALWHQFEAAKVKSPAASERFTLDLLKQCFGFDTIKAQKTISKGDREFPIRHTALGARVPIVIAPVPADDVRRTGIDESLPQFGDGTRRRSATLLLQEFLNAEDDAVWGICADGLTLRLLRDNVSLTRPAWIEADLAKIFAESLFPDFSALWLLTHQSRFGAAGSAPTDCALERWRDAGRIEGTAAREKLRNGVESALIELGQGFIEHPANAELRTALSQGKLTRQAYFEELLRLVYRLIFLFAAEDRDLLHSPDAPQSAVQCYAQGYSVGRLRERCTRRTSWDKNSDVWEGLKATFRALSEGEPLLGLPALGGLFKQGQLPHLRRCRIQNRRLLAAVWRLAWMRPDGQPLTRVNWRDMETEELGSVYESLLELTPLVSATEKSFTFAEGTEGKGNARKTSSTYYTPDSLVQALLDQTLNPLIEETIAGKSDDVAIEALLNLRIIDPACGSGHFLLAAARRLASRIARLSSPGTPSQADYRRWLREVARQTLFGVDKNPMAIELAKVALWIETVEPGKPLSFLDSHLRCGDSLLGVYDLSALQIGIPDDAYKPLIGDNKKAAAAWKARNKSERDGRIQGELSFFEPPKELLDSIREVEKLSEDYLSDVRRKADAYHALSTGDARTRMEAACDLYVAAFLSPKTEPPARIVGDKGEFIPTSRDVWDKLEGKRPLGLVEHNSITISNAACAFHWPLEFPQVFFAGDGRKPGFDLAIGNPPWDQIQLDPQEWFASRAPDIARTQHHATRAAMINNLKGSNSALFETYINAARQVHARQDFIRASGRFPTSKVGRLNTAPCFTELFSDLTTHGRAGLIAPSGIATDSFNQSLFRKLFQTRLSFFSAFENEEFIFPDVHHSFRFALIVLGRGKSSARFSFFLRSVEQSKSQHKSFTLSSSDVALINPNTLTAPVFRSSADAEITKSIYRRVPILIDESNQPHKNKWGIQFQLMFMMNTDSGHFKTTEQLCSERGIADVRHWIEGLGQDEYLPLYEGKMVHQYDHRWTTFDIDDASGREVRDSEKSDPSFGSIPRYWVPAREVNARIEPTGWTRDWLIGFRDVTSAHVLRTVISSVVPRYGAANNLPILFPSRELDAGRVTCLSAILSSLTFDFVARQKVGGNHLNFFIMQQLPVLPPETFDNGVLAFMVPRVLELTYVTHSMTAFAHDLDYYGSPFSWNENRRALLRAELDAKIAKLYGLTRDQLRYILDPADIYGPDYPSETFRVLKNNDIAKYGEYRTAKLVLDAWDRLERGELQ